MPHVRHPAQGRAGTKADAKTKVTRGARGQAGQSTTGPRAIEQRKREAQALELRIAGATYAQIARAMKRNPSTITQYVRSAMAELTREPAEQLREIELERCDALQRAFWPDALRGDEKAASMVLRVMTRRADLLGLDAPKRIETDGGDVTVITIGERLENPLVLEQAVALRGLLAQEQGELIEGEAIEEEA